MQQLLCERVVSKCRLYDNPQIAQTYLDAFRATGNPEYAKGGPRHPGLPAARHDSSPGWLLLS